MKRDEIELKFLYGLGLLFTAGGLYGLIYHARNPDLLNQMYEIYKVSLGIFR